MKHLLYLMIILILMTSNSFAQKVVQSKLQSSTTPTITDPTKLDKRQIQISAEIWRLSNDYNLDYGTVLRYTGQSGSIGFVDSIFPSEGIGSLSILTNALDMTYGKLRASLNLAQKDGKAELLTSPNIIVLNGEPCSIESDDKVAYNTIDTGNNLVTQYFRFGVNLHVTPTIIEDETNHIRLVVDLEVSEVIAERSEDDIQIPIASISKLTNTVVVKTGSVMAIGGMYREKEMNKKDGIPFLSLIPGIGDLVSSRYIQDEKTQVIFRIQANIVEDQYNDILNQYNIH